MHKNGKIYGVILLPHYVCFRALRRHTLSAECVPGTCLDKFKGSDLEQPLRSVVSVFIAR